MSAELHVYSIMRNEARILPYFLRHYESVASRIFVFDDNSDDGSFDLLSSHPKVIILSMRQPWLRTTYTTGIDDRYFRNLYDGQYRQFTRDKNVWVACVDADEFVYHPSLLELLAHADNVDVIQPAGYFMVAPSFPTTNGQIYDEIDLGIPDFWSSKPCLFRSSTDIHFRLGRHGLLDSESCTVWEDSGVRLLHYRHLGLDYATSRDARNCTRMSERNRKNLLGRHNLPGSTYQHSIAWVESNRHRIERAVP